MGKERKEEEEEGVRILRRFRVLRVEIGVNGVERATRGARPAFSSEKLRSLPIINAKHCVAGGEGVA